MKEESGIVQEAEQMYSLQGRLFLVFVASLAAVPMVGFARLSHYLGRVALLRLLGAWLSSSLIGFHYIKPPHLPVQGTILPLKDF